MIIRRSVAFTDFESDYVFCLCLEGAEKWLKAEVALRYADLKFAFSRPGFVTFKASGPNKISLGNLPRLTFSQVTGLSLGRSSAETAIAALDKIAQDERIKKMVFHATSRSPELPVEAEKARAEAETKLKSKLAGETNRKAEKNELIFHSIQVDENETWWGLSSAAESEDRFAGGNPQVALPEKAPSRAYLKIEEAIALFELDFQTGETVIEVGSAPGGASYALLQRGLQVFGIDPGEMDRVTLNSPRFKHLRTPVSQVDAKELPRSAHWILLDMNVAPQAALSAVGPMIRRYGPGLKGPGLKGVVLTLKLNQSEFVQEIERFKKIITEFGLKNVRTRQLPSNRQEFALIARP